MSRPRLILRNPFGNLCLAAFLVIKSRTNKPLNADIPDDGLIPLKIRHVEEDVDVLTLFNYIEEIE